VGTRIAAQACNSRLPCRQRVPQSIGVLPMKRRQFAAAGLSAVAIASLGQAGQAQEQRREQRANRGQSGLSSAYRECAKACSDCQRECDNCANHCGEMLSQGKNQHHTTLQTCLDCADVCAAAARIVSRSGPFAEQICEPCAEVCNRCEEACRKHGEDATMKACADQCAKCEEACRAMVRSARQDTGRKPR
jgi:hypothetical protein